jgi:two-component system OmpR family sensor kinase
LRQILSNLIENAAKYGAGSAIEVGVAESESGGARITVIDHGPGVPLEDHDRVFERFVQLDSSATRSAGGTGLGLYVCRKLADAQHATIALTDTPGGGCTFTLELPVATSANESAQVNLRPFARPARPLAAV